MEFVQPRPDVGDAGKDLFGDDDTVALVGHWQFGDVLPSEPHLREVTASLSGRGQHLPVQVDAGDATPLGDLPREGCRLEPGATAHGEHRLVGTRVQSVDEELPEPVLGGGREVLSHSSRSSPSENVSPVIVAVSPPALARLRPRTTVSGVGPLASRD
jgi:hypothetical protein